MPVSTSRSTWSCSRGALHGFPGAGTERPQSKSKWARIVATTTGARTISAPSMPVGPSRSSAALWSTTISFIGSSGYTRQSGPDSIEARSISAEPGISASTARL